MSTHTRPDRVCMKCGKFLHSKNYTHGGKSCKGGKIIGYICDICGSESVIPKNVQGEKRTCVICKEEYMPRSKMQKYCTPCGIGVKLGWGR